MAPVALITDFGIADWYAGEMKGAMLSVCPGVTIIDITHHIPPGDIRGAAFTLAACYRTFPEGTVFCVVVDPGVGSGRRAIAADTGRYRFVGPDNGVLSWAFLQGANPSVRIIDNSNDFPNTAVSATFHGRDIFGPVAAHLARGISFAAIGAETAEYEKITFPRPVVTDASITAEVLAVDRFGNAVTAIDAALAEQLNGRALKLHFRGTSHAIGFGGFFQSVPGGGLLCYPGSAGYLEIGVNGGSAAERLGLAAGDRIELLLK
ncbi:MAG: SAM-dependent chlorinase/fluorinase [Chitinispirillaceae bacterium]|nr:SAM-dependent chlorinase/fluorinase [Chitinispirillaceae bacterium]